MATIGRPRSGAAGETAGFLASLAFMALASVRDVYFGGLFQSTDPLGVAIVGFAACALGFAPIALVRSPESFRLLARRPGEVLAVNVTTALAWIAFFYALRTVLVVVSGGGLSLGGSRHEIVIAVAAVLALIVFPIYVNQVGTALASPLTVRAVLALGLVVIFVLQLVEGRLTPSPWSLACALFYGPLAVSAAVARRRSSMRSVSMSASTVRGSRNVEV